MQPSKLELLQARLLSFKTVLAATSEKAKRHNVARPVAENFNQLLEDIAVHFLFLQSSLPKPISFNSDAAMVAGQSDVDYIGLEIMAEQVLAILKIVG